MPDPSNTIHSHHRLRRQLTLSFELRLHSVNLYQRDPAPMGSGVLPWHSPVLKSSQTFKESPFPQRTGQSVKKTISFTTQSQPAKLQLSLSHTRWLSTPTKAPPISSPSLSTQPIIHALWGVHHIPPGAFPTLQEEPVKLFSVLWTVLCLFYKKVTAQNCIAFIIYGSTDDYI